MAADGSAMAHFDGFQRGCRSRYSTIVSRGKYIVFNISVP